VGRRHLRDAVERVGVVQLDAVNVVARAQLLALFSRVGPYDVATFHRMNGPGGELFECWAHMASLVPMAHEPLQRPRAALARAYGASPARAARQRAFHEEHADYLGALLDEVAARGPLRAGQLEDPRPQEGEWWGRRSLGRWGLEFLFARGELAAWRTPSFERVYDLPERVVPPSVRARPTPADDEAASELLLLAAGALGVATAGDLADYHRQPAAVARARVAELVADGRLIALRVEGWSEPAYARPGARAAGPRRDHATLVSPFDSLVWDRRRAARVFGFDYRIEVYVPGPRRVYGYYVLPLLLDDRLVARLDLKADRRASVLRVGGAFAEPGVDADAAAGAAAAELRALASWLGLDDVVVERRGDLSAALAAQRSTSGANS
jgi:uncharacterized protein YcaQ